MEAENYGIKTLADKYTVIYESPDAQKISVYTPALVKCPNGRLVATFDINGSGMNEIPGPKAKRWPHEHNQCWIRTSNVYGKTWQQRAALPLFHATPFVAGNSLYLLGHSGDLAIAQSNDWGETWQGPFFLTTGQIWTGHTHNVIYTNNCIYIPMERYVRSMWRGLAPVLMRGCIDADLTRQENWTFASELVFEDAVNTAELDFFGVPFFSTEPDKPSFPAPGREMTPAGWLEPNVVRITDPDHYWYDPQGKTFHLLLRSHLGVTGYAALAKVIEQGNMPGTGAMTTAIETVPSGKRIMFLPCPGGQMKFSIIYDEPSKRYWLLSTQATDSMTRIERLPADRYNLPNNERRRLQLHFSKNLVDWCFWSGSSRSGRKSIASLCRYDC